MGVAFRHRESRLKNFCSKLLEWEWMIDVCFTPESRHSDGSRKTSAYDPKRTMGKGTENKMIQRLNYQN